METESIKWLLVWLYLIPATLILGAYTEAVMDRKFDTKDHTIAIILIFCPVLNIAYLLYHIVKLFESRINHN